MALVRFGVSLEKKLIEEFDSLILKRNYTNRSEAIRDMIREELVKDEWSGTNQVIGAITLVYDHHKREVVNRLIDIQHDFHGNIISSQHVHVDHCNCLEIIAAKGISGDVARLSDMLKSVKGVVHVSLSMSSTGKKITQRCSAASHK